MTDSKEWRSKYGSSISNIGLSAPISTSIARTGCCVGSLEAASTARPSGPCWMNRVSTGSSVLRASSVDTDI